MKPKYNVGDNIWRIKEGKAIQEEITLVVIKKNKKYAYSTRINDSFACYADFGEDELFLTKEDLIASL